jgi:hypothetical protein
VILEGILVEHQATHLEDHLLISILAELHYIKPQSLMMIDRLIQTDQGLARHLCVRNPLSDQTQTRVWTRAIPLLVTARLYAAHQLVAHPFAVHRLVDLRPVFTPSKQTETIPPLDGQHALHHVDQQGTSRLLAQVLPVATSLHLLSRLLVVYLVLFRHQHTADQKALVHQQHLQQAHEGTNPQHAGHITHEVADHPSPVVSDLNLPGAVHHLVRHPVPHRRHQLHPLLLVFLQVLVRASLLQPLLNGLLNPGPQSQHAQPPLLV